MTSSLGKLGFIFIGIFFSAIASAAPILVFESYAYDHNQTLLGADNVVLGDHSYDVRFTHSAATIFANQELADAASRALIDQVFALEAFASLSFCGNSGSCDESSVWFTRNRSGLPVTSVKQYWGEFSLDEECSSPWPGETCMRRINASYANFYDNTDFPVNRITTAPWLISCGDCGASGSIWTERTEVPEPSSCALLMISLAGLVLMRAKRFNIALFKRRS